MEISRNMYLKRLADSQDSSLIKVITGIRRCGKSYLLFTIFCRHLISQGVMEDHILRIALDSEENESLLQEGELSKYVKSRTKGEGRYYVILDEIQNLKNFVKVLNGLNRQENLDIYVTGSNSRFLSGDVVTDFRGRSDEIRIYPLNFSEYLEAFPESEEKAFRKFCLFGGMPQVVLQKSDEKKMATLRQLFDNVYVNDIVERYGLRKEEGLDRLLDVLASNVGSLTSPSKMAATFNSAGYRDVTNKTIDRYVDCLRESFLISKADRYDVLGKTYVSTPYKLYFSDMGLRNARLNFRQFEENHLVENAVYNELLARGYSVDVGMVSSREKSRDGRVLQKRLEVDFVATRGFNRYYIQVAYGVPDMEKFKQETASLSRISDSFPKVLLVMSNVMPWMAENGLKVISVIDFLTNPEILKI